VLTGRIGRHFDWLAEVDDRVVGRLVEVLGALSSRKYIGFYLRQLPIAGLDSKWMGANRVRVNELLRPLLPGEGAEDATSDLWSIACRPA
jgi:hypothetical protein